MNTARFSAIAHTHHRYCNPINQEQVDVVLERLELHPGARVLDIGCGKGTLLLDMAMRAPIQGVGIDKNGAWLEEARRAVPVGAAVQFIEQAAESFAPPLASFDVACCVGSSHAYGGYLKAIAALTPLVVPEGQLLMGEGYWQRQPPSDYLEYLGGSADDLFTHAGNVAAARQLGWHLHWASVASPGDWDAYEGLYLHTMERWCRDHPEDPETSQFRERIRGWHDAYLRWGRDTLGFALYLFQRDKE